MYISEILEITNYRNLTGKRIKFNETLNFLIGENNIGKTNMLELINIFLSVGKFIESDFTDVMRPIRIRLRIKYSDEEVGYFEDNFDVDDSRSITLLAVQDSVDKEEIIRISRKIGTFDTSILPYEDCCTVFTPRHPKTKPRVEEVRELEAVLDIDALCDRAMAGREFVRIKF